MPRVITTEQKDFKALGRRADYTWEVLRDRLTQELGLDYGLLLAEPITEVGWGRVDWHTDYPGQAKRISDLDAVESAALLERLHAMRVQVDALAGRIEGERRSEKGLADALRRAIVIPDDSRFVWSIGGKPLLVAWGMLYIEDARSEAAVIGEGLLRRARKRFSESLPLPPPETLSPPHRMASRVPWSMLWLLFVGLLGAIYFLLLEACGILVAPENSAFRRFLPAACHATAAFNPFAEELAERAELERKIKKAELDLARLQGDCTPPAPPPQRQAEIPPPRPQPQGPTIEQRLDRESAQTGELQISLAWNGMEDLDLHVKCPGGLLNYHNRGDCGGALDVDMNHERSSVDAVENSFWASPPRGRYEVSVAFHSRRGEQPRTIPFVVRIKRGNDVQTFNGSIATEGETREVHAFTL